MGVYSLQSVIALDACLRYVYNMTVYILFNKLVNKAVLNKKHTFMHTSSFVGQWSLV